MIVKNEAKNLPNCINDVKAAVDEIIVVDTGSADETREIARQLGARVFDFLWCDDFSAARNESIRHATGDYILWLDADDRIDLSEVKKIKHLKTMLDPQKTKAYYLVVNSQSPVDGETLFHQLRIFPNIRGARFEGRIHEQVFHILGRMGIQFVQTDVVIRHTGYPDASIVVTKSERNLRIIEKELESDPDNLLLHYNAARTLSGLGRHAEAIVHLQRITDDGSMKKNDKPFYLAAALLLGKYYVDVQQYGQAVSIYKDLSRDFEGQGLVHYCLGQALFLIKDFKGAREELEKSLLHPVEVSLFPVNINGIYYYQYYTLGECYLETGETDLAKKMFIKSLDFPSDHQKSLQALGLMALRDQQFEEAIEYYKRAIEKGVDSDQIYSNLGLAYRKFGLWAEAEKALLKALEVNPQRLEALTNLGHLYYQRKEYPKAIEVFSKGLDLAPNLTDVRLALSDIYFRFCELEKLVQECDALLKELGLPRDRTLNGFDELATLYEEIGETLLRNGRNDLSLMAFHVSFLIHPSKGVLEKIAFQATFLKVLENSLQKIKEALEFNGFQGEVILDGSKIQGGKYIGKTA